MSLKQLLDRCGANVKIWHVATVGLLACAVGFATILGI